MMQQLHPVKALNYKQIIINDTPFRYVKLDCYGNKDKIVLKTKSGKYITRTCLYYESQEGITKIRITYKGKPVFIKLDKYNLPIDIRLPD